MKKILLIFLVIVLFSFTIIAQEEHDFDETKQLIDSGVSCDKLTNEQLEIVGDYYMEQMHPGEQHEMMDEMMGGEGSESLKQVHINMARNIYCGESGGMMNGGMMNMMGGGDMMAGNYYCGYNIFGITIPKHQEVLQWKLDLNLNRLLIGQNTQDLTTQ